MAKPKTPSSGGPRDPDGFDPFTIRRLEKFIVTFRQKKGQLPTLLDLKAEGFEEGLIDMAVKKSILEKLYVTLTNGVILKGYKLRDPD